MTSHTHLITSPSSLSVLKTNSIFLVKKSILSFIPALPSPWRFSLYPCYLCRLSPYSNTSNQLARVILCPEPGRRNKTLPIMFMKRQLNTRIQPKSSYLKQKIKWERTLDIICRCCGVSVASAGAHTVSLSPAGGRDSYAPTSSKGSIVLERTA